MFQIRSEQTGDVAILECHGRLVRGSTQILRDAVTSLRGARIVVLDLSAVETMDGGGLGMLVFLHHWTRDNGMGLKLVNPNAFLREVLGRTRLVCVFDISSVEDAVEILCTAETAEDPAQATRAVA